MDLIENVNLINQIITVIRTILTTDQISIYEFRDAFIDGKAKLVTLNNNNNFAPFLFMNYNGKNYNTNISLETISELFEKGVDVEELNKMIMSWF